MKRIGTAILLCTAAVSIGAPSTGFAQNDDGRVRFTATPGYAGEGMPYRDCSLGAGEDLATQDDALRDAPARRDTVALPSGITAEQAEAIRVQRREVLGGQIVQFDNMLSTMPATYPNRPVILYRKAEALRELADADYLAVRVTFNDCMTNWYTCASDAECYEPMPDYTEAIQEYGDIARNHPDYNRLDEVIFRLGETLMENDDAAQGTTYLTRLVNTYPNSQYIPDARLLMAEYFFEIDVLTSARQNYEEVLRFPQSDVYNYAIYKIGWVDINDGQYEDALTRFQTVVTNLEAGAAGIDIRNQSLNDMVRVYAELDNGWQRARDYYQRVENEDFMRRKLTQLAGLFDDQGKDESRVEVLAFFLDRYPMDSKVPQWAEETLDSLGKIGNWDRTEQNARQFISMLEPTSRWSLQNQGNPRELTTARQNSEAWLLMIITRNDQEARRLSDPSVKRALFEEVAADYADFFVRFSDSTEAYTQRFYYAETVYQQLANQGNCGARGHFMPVDECQRYLRRAGDEYRAVVEMRPEADAEHTHDAATGALEVYDTFMAATNPQVEQDLPAPGEYERVFGALIRNPQELNADATNYVEIVEWFARIFPNDEQIPAASWRAASLYLYSGHAGEAAARFETIIEHHPRHRFAQQAALAAFVCYNFEENWVKIESVARRLLAACSGDTRICNPESLSQAIAYAMNNQATDLMAEGDALRIDDERAAQAKYLEAAEKRVGLYREFPNSEWAPLALMNAAATFEQARRIRTSIELYNEFLTSYENHESTPEVYYTLGLIHESQANFEEAAQWLERTDAFVSFENRADAILTAARLREAMSDFDDAVRLYEHYQTLEPTRDETKEIYFQIAGIERTRNNPDAAFTRLQQYIDRYPGERYGRLRATHTQARIRLDQARNSDALSLFDAVHDQFGRGVANFDAGDLFTGWTTQPGGNFSDEAERLRALPMAAEAVFRTADVAYNAARVADLNYRVGRTQELVAKLQARGTAIIAGQRAMLQASNMGDAEWSVAAVTRTGQLYKDFYRDMYNLPAPDYDQCLDATNGNYDMCDEAIESFEGTLFDYGSQLEARAMAAWSSARDIAMNNGIYTEWTRLLIQEMNDTDRNFRVGGAEGVVASNVSDPFIATRYILDLTEKLEAFEDFVPPVPSAVDGSAPDLNAPATDAAPAPAGDFGTGM